MVNRKWLTDVTTKKFLFKDLPRRCSLDEYSETVKKITDHYLNLDCLQAVYQLGSVSAPGISDLDIVLIFDNTVPTGYETYQHFLNEKQQYIAGHTNPFLLSKRIFNNLPVIFFPSTLQFLGGKKQTVRHRSEEEMEIFRLCYSTDAAITELLWLLDRLTSGTIPIRTMLCHLYSVKYDIKSLFDIASVEHADGAGFVRQIENLRLNWFDLPEGYAHSQIIDLGSKASEILFDVINDLGSYLKKNYVKDGLFNSFYLAEVNSIIHFTENGGNSVKHYDFLLRNRFLNSYCLDMATGAGIPLLLYSEHNSEAGWRLRRHLMFRTVNPAVVRCCDTRLQTAITKKMQILDEYWNFLKRVRSTMSFFEGPWWNNSRLYKIKHFFWKLLLT